MIYTKNDLRRYIKLDKIALGLSNKNSINLLKNLLFPNYIERFQKFLRICEYHKNNNRDFIHKILFIYYYFLFVKLSVKLGFSIPLNVFGPGLCIVHYGTIVVSVNAKIGANCRIHPSTCIGAAGGKKEAPTIGDNVYIGPGAKLYGNIIIGNNIAIAPNAAVSSSFTDEKILIGGVPARYIKNIDISNIIKHLKK
jgi:serine O-acetyltransferase